MGILFFDAGTYFYDGDVKESAIYSSLQTDVNEVFSIENIVPNNQLSLYSVYSFSSSAVEEIEFAKTLLLGTISVALIFASIIAILIIKKKRTNVKK